MNRTFLVIALLLPTAALAQPVSPPKPAETPKEAASPAPQLSADEAKAILTLISRVQITGAEAPIVTQLQADLNRIAVAGK